MNEPYASRTLEVDLKRFGPLPYVPYDQSKHLIEVIWSKDCITFKVDGIIKYELESDSDHFSSLEEFTSLSAEDFLETYVNIT